NMENKQTTIEEVQPVSEVTAVEQKVEEIKFPTIQNNQTDLSTFGNKEGFEHSMRVAKALSVSDLVPQQYKGNVSNCLIAMDISKRIGASELMVMQNLYIVHGKPAWSSQFLIATLNACKKFSPLRYEEDDKNGGRCRAYAVDLATGERLEGVWVTMEMAAAEKWLDKAGSKWKTMPQLMMRYRAAAFFTRQFAPEVSMGIMTSEEVIDITPIQNQKPQTQWTQE
ncbi:MAG: hypothetical protein ACO3FO_07335, partial [Candidatus Nanopelagicaceae bacterium]